MKEVRVPIRGMHCRSCEITISHKLQEIPGVHRISVSHKKKEARMFLTRPVADESIHQAIKDAGYEIGAEQKPWITKNFSDYRDVFIGLLVVLIVLFIINRSGITTLNTSSLAGKGALMALLVGLTAGLSTCMALIGGLVLGLSAKHAEAHPEATPLQNFRPHLFFNASRIITFIILGGFIGAAGSVFQISGTVLGGLMILVGVVMFMLGLQLTELFPRLSSGGITLPAGIARKLGIAARPDAEYSHRGAISLGAISFFLPCGFTQAMQLYAVSTGSFVSGAIIMGLFAVGTAPGLLGIGGLASVVKGVFARRFFKVAGVAVMAFAIINIANGYTLSGLKNSFSLSGSSAPATSASAKEEILNTKFRIVDRDSPFLGNIFPETFNVDAGKKYTLVVTAEDDGVGCMSTIMIPGLVDKPQLLKAGETYRLTFVAERPGLYPITCAMGVPFGRINVS